MIRPVAGGDPLAATVLERRLYPVAEAARLLRMSPSTLSWWLEGDVQRGYAPVLRSRATGDRTLTWGEYVEAGYLREYRKRKVPLQELRPYVERLREEFGVPYPLAHARPYVGPGRRLVERVEDALGLDAQLRMIVISSGQRLLGGPAEAFVERVEFAPEGPAVRLFPAGASSQVVIDPMLGGGAPTVRGIRTDALPELVARGEPLAVVAADFGLPLGLLQQALAYEWSAAA